MDWTLDLDQDLDLDTGLDLELDNYELIKWGNLQDISQKKFAGGVVVVVGGLFDYSVKQEVDKIILVTEAQISKYWTEGQAFYKIKCNFFVCNPTQKLLVP